MKHTKPVIWLIASAVALGACWVPGEASARVVLESRGPRHHRMPSPLEFVVEGGLLEPAGDQKDDFWTTDVGFDAGTGYQIGARLRQYLGGFVAVSPAFHYSRFGEAEGVADFGGSQQEAYRLLTSNFRYGVDLQAFMGEPGAIVRPYVTGGIALIHNRYRDELQYGGIFTTSVNTPAYSAGFGLRMGNLELSGEYTFNRFSTDKLSAAGEDLDYNWDHFAVRVGLAFGR